MSFGWSVGDIANLIHVCWKVYKTFNDAQDAGQHYRALANEFSVRESSLASTQPAS